MSEKEVRRDVGRRKMIHRELEEIKGRLVGRLGGVKGAGKSGGMGKGGK